MRSVLMLVLTAFLSGCGSGAPSGPQLCAGAGGSSATYAVFSGVAGLTLWAGIELPGAGYTLALEKHPGYPAPPQFRLMCTPPAEVSAAVITQYQTSFEVDGPAMGDAIVIQDHRISRITR
jgi:hypothetical protein